MDSNSPRYSTFWVLLRYGPLRQIWLCAMGHCSEFGDALWATAANLMMRYGPLLRIWLGAMGRCGGFGDALWATAANFVMRYGPL